MVRKLKKIIAVAGPTAIGKSNFAVNLALKIDGEIISADSCQVYRHLNIGSGKITENEKKGIKHHLLSFLNPNDNFSLANFQKMAFLKIVEIWDKNKIPILCGGTGLFIDSVMKKYDIPNTKANEDFRGKMNSLSREKIFKMLSSELQNKHTEKEKRKMIRELEILKFKPKQVKAKFDFDFDKKYFVLFCERNKLYEKINLRTEKMFKNGLLDECKFLIKKQAENCQPAKAIAYKEGIDFLQNKIPLDDAIFIAQKRARNYAKRQLTWFRGRDDIEWIEI